MHVLGGNQRLAAIRKLGMKEIPDEWAIAATDLTPEQQKEFVLRDNVQLGEWDFEMLSVEFAEFDLSEMGMDMPEIDVTPPEATDEDFDEPDIQTVQTDIKRGDIIEIGRHRLMCGDSTSESDVAMLMNGQKADMIFADPPYNIDYHGKGKRTQEKLQNDNMEREAFHDFLFTSFSEMKNSAPKAPIYICHNYKMQSVFEIALDEAGYQTKAQIVWVKPGCTLGMQEYRNMHELIFYAIPKKSRPKFYGDRKQYTVWKEGLSDDEVLKRYRKVYEKVTNGNSTVWEFGRASDYIHPTQKPVLLVAKAIENSSRPKDIILDPFIGSGTTMVACHQLDRICYGMEISEQYCQVIVDRMRKLDSSIEIKINGEIYV